MEKYFFSMLTQLQENKLQEADLYQLFQDMVNLNFVWDKPELELQSRMMIQKNLIKAPAGYVHREVTVEEIVKMQNSRKSLITDPSNLN